MGESEALAQVGPDAFDALCEEAVQDLLEGPKFVVVCPQCEEFRAVALNPMYYAALSNEFGRSVDKRFDMLSVNPPESLCPYCLFRGGTDA